MSFQLKYTIYFHHFQEYSGTEWVREQYKNGLVAVDEYNIEIDLIHIDERLLDLFIQDYLEETKDYEDYSFYMFLQAGFFLKMEDQTISHQCCGSFLDYDDFYTKIKKRHSQWEELWIGHPWIYYKKEGATILFSEYYDKDPVVESITPKLILPFDKFMKDLNELMGKIRAFENFVEKYLAQHYPNVVI